MRLTIPLLLLVCSCHRGDLSERCNLDGTCNSPNLVCFSWADFSECRTPPPVTAPNRCHGAADCFCLRCADSCVDAGVKSCAYSDTSTWGAKPATCECK